MDCVGQINHWADSRLQPAHGHIPAGAAQALENAPLGTDGLADGIAANGVATCR